MNTIVGRVGVSSSSGIPKYSPVNSDVTPDFRKPLPAGVTTFSVSPSANVEHVYFTIFKWPSGQQVAGWDYGQAPYSGDIDLPAGSYYTRTVYQYADQPAVESERLHFTAE